MYLHSEWLISVLFWTKIDRRFLSILYFFMWSCDSIENLMFKTLIWPWFEIKSVTWFLSHPSSRRIRNNLFMSTLFYKLVTFLIKKDWLNVVSTNEAPSKIIITKEKKKKRPTLGKYFNSIVYRTIATIILLSGMYCVSFCSYDSIEPVSNTTKENWKCKLWR